MTQPGLFDDDSFADAIKTMNTAYARRTDPSTSQAAAASLTGQQLRRSQAEVLEVLRRYGPCTDVALVEFYEAAAAVGMRVGADLIAPQSPSGIRTRRRELQTLERVRDTGQRVRLQSRRMAVVWEVTP